jgi:hypothetical protein
VLGVDVVAGEGLGVVAGAEQELSARLALKVLPEEAGVVAEVDVAGGVGESLEGGVKGDAQGVLRGSEESSPAL